MSVSKNTATAGVDPSILKQFHPIDLIAEEYLSQLANKALIVDVAKGSYIFSAPRNSSQSYYLLSGKLDLRCKLDRKVIDAMDPCCYYPLEEKQPSEASAKALSHCQVLQCSRDLIDQLLSWSQSAEYGVVDISTRSDGELIEDNDWMDSLVESPLMQNLSASDMYSLFDRLEDIKVSAGDTIIQQGQAADYFYIIKKGHAEVCLPAAGQKNIVLQPGDYFGEEAMVAETVRSASIQMTSDGVLARLDHAEFNQILRDSLVRHARETQMQALMDDVSTCVVIDVRLRAEFVHGHGEQSRNIPINQLRNKLASFDKSKLYLVSPEGGRRSELATYMLCQAGFDAYLLEDDHSSELPKTG